MRPSRSRLWIPVIPMGAAFCLMLADAPEAEAQVRLYTRRKEPFNLRRPDPNQVDVPLKTSVCLALASEATDGVDDVDLDSVTISLQPDGGERFDVLRSGSEFA
ncbi:MAG: hypothetical protein ACYTGQ_05265, partial [Planctomycetota bacterium]